MKVRIWRAHRGLCVGLTLTCWRYDWNLIFWRYPRNWRLSFLNAIGNLPKQIQHEGIVLGFQLWPIGCSVVWDDADMRFDSGTGYFIG